MKRKPFRFHSFHFIFRIQTLLPLTIAEIISILIPWTQEWHWTH